MELSSEPDPSKLVLFLGHFHPLLVNLPIGGLALLAFLELLAKFSQWKDAAQNSRWILAFVSGTAILSAACGWMLAQAGGYNSHLVKWHQAAGISVVVALLVTLVLHHLRRPRIYCVSLFAALVLAVVASHQRGSITQGSDFLIRYAPEPLRAFLGRSILREPITPVASTPLQRPVFSGVIEPILRQRCSACHGEDKHKAELRLDTLEELLRGGQDGPVIKAGEAKDSPLIQCLLSPLDADGHMPPEDQPQTTVEEIALLEWWINDGAPDAQRVVDLKPEPKIRRLMEVVSKQSEPTK